MPSFFTTKFSLWAIGILFAALLALLGTEELRIHNWRVENKAQADALTVAASDLAVCHANVVTFAASLDTQNMAIAAMATKAEADKAEADARVKATIDARKSAPRTVGTTPAALNAWFREEYGVKR